MRQNKTNKYKLINRRFNNPLGYISMMTNNLLAIKTKQR